jgi:5-methylcytosine-specific restriction protein B
MPELRHELDTLIDQYEAILGDPSDAPLPIDSEMVRPDIGEASRKFSAALRDSFVDFGSHHDDVVASFIASLVTKPLVILTGLSGSGKTQLAIRFGEWLGEGRLHVAAVRPDWTGAEALFGYEDGLKPALEGRAAWLVPAPLEFILLAANDPSNPCLLLLDEMNLAHVERYFADVLSGMESGQPCLPNLIRGGDGVWRVRAQGPAQIPFPRNVWIVGTVNVDETTYMFSPKVLDRASTFEFRVGSADLKATSQKPVRCAPGDPALIRGLLSIARDDRWQLDHIVPFQSDIERRLKQLHAVLARHGLEFGHRVFYESLRFSAFAVAAGLADLDKVLDRILLQKVLPRLHGSRRRLELTVLALVRFCHALPDDVESDDQLPGVIREQQPDSMARLPLSFEKMCRILSNLRANQFASFTE